MELRYSFLLILLLLFFVSNATENQKENEDDLDADEQRTQYEYVQLLFKDKRRQQHAMIKEMLQKDTYEKKYRLLQVSYSKIFELLKSSNETLSLLHYQAARDGFPMENMKLQGAVVITLDSCCMAAESVLHFPDISYRIFRKINVDSWKSTLNWCIEFLQYFPKITDESSSRLMALLRQEINEELRVGSYMNPYSEAAKRAAANATVQAKQRKQFKKGPQLNEL